MHYGYQENFATSLPYSCSFLGVSGCLATLLPHTGNRGIISLYSDNDPQAFFSYSYLMRCMPWLKQQ